MPHEVIPVVIGVYRTSNNETRFVVLEETEAELSEKFYDKEAKVKIFSLIS